MVHVAPFHPAAASLYDPATDRDEKLYPFGAIEPPIDAPQDRSIAAITTTGPQAIAIAVTEQDLRWGANASIERVGSERKRTISCDLSTSPPRCSVQPRR